MAEKLLFGSHPREFLELPLVHGYRTGHDLVQKRRIGWVLEQHAAKLGRARTFVARGYQQNSSAGFQDMSGGCHTLNGLVEREVERISGRGGDHRVHGLFERLEHHLRDELHPGAMRLLGMSREDAGDRAVAGERYVDDEIVPGHAGDFEELAV